MPLQSQVNLSVAPGVAGDKATPDQSIYTPLNPLAAVALPVGRFVFPVVDSGVIDNTQATNVAGTATAVLGFVERVINYVNYEIFSDGTLTVPVLIEPSAVEARTACPTVALVVETAQ